MELNKVKVMRAEELPERTQKKFGVFGKKLVELHLFGNPQRVEVKTIRGRFSDRMDRIMEEDGLFIDGPVA